MSAGQAPKRRSSSIIERSQYAPSRQQGDDRRREFDSLGQDHAANERARHDIAEIARQQSGRAGAPVQLDDIEAQQRKSLRMVVTPAPLDPAPVSDASSQPDADETATPAAQAPAVADHSVLPPAVATTKQVRAKKTQQPAVGTTKQVRAEAPATRTRFEYVEHSPAHSGAPARSMPKGYPTAYPRDEHYAPQEVYHYWEAPVALARNNPLLLLILVALVCVPVIGMLMQSPKTIISGYDGSGWNALSHVASNVLGGLGGSAGQPAIEVPAGEHSILGQPSITADQVEAVLAQYNSPARGTGQIWIDLGTKYGIDPAYPLAFFVQESTAGTNRGWAGLKSDGSTTHNVGNIICAGYATCYKGNRDYPSWEAGIDDWYRLIAREYVEGRGLASVEQILPIYCPVSDGCRSYDYISIVNSMVGKWHQGQLFR
jgi:hypothetical protein